MQKTHGMSCVKTANGYKPTDIYRIWANIKSRCYNQNHPRYKDYGKRGIRMCESWKNSFEAFYKDVGARPDGLTLDRINNNKGYTPGNVRWVSRAENNRNSRRCVMVTIHGVAKPVNVWCREFGVPYSTYKQRRRNGWDYVSAVSTTPDKRRARKK